MILQALLQIRVQLAAVGCPLYGDSLYALQTAPETLQVLLHSSNGASVVLLSEKMVPKVHAASCQKRVPV